MPDSPESNVCSEGDEFKLKIQITKNLIGDLKISDNYYFKAYKNNENTLVVQDFFGQGFKLNQPFTRGNIETFELYNDTNS